MPEGKANLPRMGYSRHGVAHCRVVNGTRPRAVFRTGYEQPEHSALAYMPREAAKKHTPTQWQEVRRGTLYQSTLRSSRNKA